MQTRNWEDFAAFDADGHIINREGTLNIDAVNQAEVSITLGEISATPTALPGNLDGTEDGDLIAVTLVAGQTYTFDFRGAPGGLVDPYLFLLSPDLSAALAQDDDGGAGTSSQITYTATADGTYYLYATSFEAAAGGSPASDFGDYTINMWSPEADVPGSTDVVASLATAVTIGAGTTFGNLDVRNDNDYYAVQVEAGQVYTFNYSGGVSGAADRNGEAGENLAFLTLYNSAGVSLGTNFNYESALSYFATANTTIYVRVEGSNEPALGGTGGYTLDVGTIDPSTRDPLESLNWDSADDIDTVLVDGVPTAYVYFGAPGENFGETVANVGWQPHQIAAVMMALGEYTPITGINYVITTDVAQAEFRMMTVATATYGARFYPQDPAYGTQQGIGTFNLGSGGFGTFPQSLERGGYSYAVILHEFGHAHGIAHPHDTGGGSEVMLGVTGATGSLGVYNLNQGAYTVMSYNDAWRLHPDGPSAFTVAGIDNGWSATLGAFDIAVLQARYGVHANNGGDNVYALTDVADDANYQTIWDTGGTDTIAYGGTLNAQIDLTAATLDYTPTGGGVISFLYNPQPPIATNSFLVRGGFTIANGVVVENATGGSGNDVLIGNSAANLLTGNVGNDNLIGRDGNDTLDGGIGDDTMVGGIGDDTYIVGEVGDVVTELLGEGTDTVVSSLSYTLGDNVETLVLTGTAANGTGNALDNTLVANAAKNVLTGGLGSDTVSYANATAGVAASLFLGWGLLGDAAGDRFISIENLEGSNFNDILTGGVGNDTVIGLGGNDIIAGLFGNDILSGGAGVDVLSGDWGNDVLDGGSDNDTLFGGDGNDVLNGGAGNDRLEGGSGNDRFVFSDLGGTDRIVDFSSGRDKIDLSLFDPSNAAGDQKMVFINKAAFSSTAGEVRTYRDGHTNYVAGDVNGDGIADFIIDMGSDKVVSSDFFL